MPFGRDQKDNGVRIEMAGAWLSLSPSASPARIAAAIRRVLEEPGFRQGAQRMATVIARDVREDCAVSEMEALAGHSSSGAYFGAPLKSGSTVSH
jgi:UDP:flavonoid glycosyltransferase YjiC (YdhE family)